MHRIWCHNYLHEICNHLQSIQHFRSSCDHLSKMAKCDYHTSLFLIQLAYSVIVRTGELSHDS